MCRRAGASPWWNARGIAVRATLGAVRQRLDLVFGNSAEGAGRGNEIAARQISARENGRGWARVIGMSEPAVGVVGESVRVSRRVGFRDEQPVCIVSENVRATIGDPECA